MPEHNADNITVFICYAREDAAMALRLYDDLRRAGVSPSGFFETETQHRMLNETNSDGAPSTIRSIPNSLL